MTKRHWRRVLSLLCSFLMFSVLSVSAKGGSEGGYALFGAKSSDKRANIKATVLIIQDFNGLTDAAMEDAVALCEQYYDQWSVGKERILSQEPMIWETDTLFAERLADELEALDSRLEEEFDAAMDAVYDRIEEKAFELQQLFEESVERLKTGAQIHLPANTGAVYAPYLRNERLWPLRLTFFDHLVENTTLDLVIDFAGEGRSEEAIRSSIVAFDAMMREGRVTWDVSYHIIPDIRLKPEFDMVEDGGSNYFDLVRFLFVLDEVAVTDDEGTVLFSRSLEEPVLFQTITVDDELRFTIRNDDPVVGVASLYYEDLMEWEKTLRSPRKNILLADPSVSIDGSYEEERLAELPPPVRTSAVVEEQGVGADAPASGDDDELAPVMPDIPLFTLDGRQTSFDAVRGGKPAIINYFASWVPPSKAELPYFEEAWRQYGDEIAFIFLAALDTERETEETITTFVKEFPFEAPIYWDEGIFAFIFDTNSLPTTVFFDKDGRIVTGFLGMMDEQTLHEVIALLLYEG